MLNILMNINDIHILICSVITGALGLYLLFSKNCRSQYPSFILFVCSVAIWMGSIFVIYNTHNYQILFLTSYFSFISSGLIFPAFARFVSYYPTGSKLTPGLFFRYYGLQLILIPATLSGLVFSGLIIEIPKCIYGPLYPLFLLNLVTYSSIVVFFLIKKTLTMKGQYKLQMKYLAIVTATGAALAISCNSVLPYLNLLNTSSIGPVFAMLVIFGIYFVIAKHSFLDIQLVIRKGLVLSILIAVYSLVYFLIIINVPAVNNTLRAILLIAAVILYSPLKTYIKNFLDKTVFKLEIEHQKNLASISEKILYAHDFQTLFNMLQDILTELLQPSMLLVATKEDGVWYKWEKTEKTELKNGYSKAITTLTSKFNPAESDQIAYFDKHKKIVHKDVQVLLPLVLNKEISGYIALGFKQGSDFYTKKDKQFFYSLANNASLAIANVYHLNQYKQSFNQLLQSEKLAMIGKTTASLAHEIKNPLNGISLAAGNIIDIIEEGKVDLQIIASTASSIIDNVSALNKKLYEMMSMTRNDELKLTATDPIDLINSVLFLIKKQAQQNNIEITYLIDKGLNYINIDPAKIRQVLLNICLNAIQAMPNGGKLTIKVAMSRGDLKLSVADSGQGIAPEIRPLIFRPFVTSKPLGTGLGLYISNEIITAHKGQIKIESNKNKGTVFSVLLPQPGKEN